MGGPRYDEQRARRAYDQAEPAATGREFWEGVAEILGRPADGVERQLGYRWRWLPKTTSPRPCALCGEFTAWDDLADGGRKMVCGACAPEST